MKHAWIINHYAKDPSEAGGTRHFHLAKHLKALDWEVTIIAASVDHATGLQRLADDEVWRHETLQGVPFLWVNTPRYSGNGGGRMRNMLVFSSQLVRKRVTAQLPRPDIVIGSSVHPFAAFSGALLARRFGVPFIFEVRDLWPQTLVDMGRLRDDAFVTWALRKLELWLYRHAARTVVLLPLAWEYIVPLGIAKEAVVWIPNGVDLSLFPRSINAYATKHQGFTFMYFGAHGQANGLVSLLDAMALIQKMPAAQRIRLRLIGDGPLKPALVEQARKLQLSNVQFEAPIAKSQIPAVAAQADAFIIPIPDLPRLYRFGISPNKLFDYLAAGRPIIIATSAANNPVADAGAGLTVPPSDPEALADAMAQLSQMHPVELQRLGDAGRDYVERNHGMDQLAERLASVLDQAISESGKPI